jgi:UDPglucose 6-dehydrogenase
MIVPTPSRDDGLFSDEYVLSVAKNIGPHLENKKDYHVFVLVSTVLPGDSRTHIIPAFEKHSGKKHGKDFGYVYSPSLVAIGDILHNLEHPDMLFLGATDEKSRDIIEEIYLDIHPTKTSDRMQIESAEIAKISLNSFVTMKITFANTLGELCSKIPHADVDEVTRAIGKDKRIGSAYLRSGLGYGGPCFPRDNFALANMAKKRGTRLPLAVALATHYLNHKVWKNALAAILKHLPKGDVCGVLGISYKPNTTVSEDSQARWITEGLVKRGHDVVLFEPMGHHHEAIHILKNTVRYADTLTELVKKSDVIFISNADKKFLSLPRLANATKGKKIIIDPWGMFKKKDFKKNIQYVSLGRNS